MGFFAEVGPFQVFVAKAVILFTISEPQKLIPNDMQFDASGTSPCYANEDTKIEKDSHIRLKIISVREESNTIVMNFQQLMVFSNQLDPLRTTTWE